MNLPCAKRPIPRTIGPAFAFLDCGEATLYGKMSKKANAGPTRCLDAELSRLIAVHAIAHSYHYIEGVHCLI